MEGFIVSSIKIARESVQLAWVLSTKVGDMCDERVNGSVWNAIKIPGAFNPEFAGRTARDDLCFFQDL